jgi:hypothetical protein
MKKSTHLYRFLIVPLLLLVPMLFIVAENQLLPWLYHQENGAWTQEYYTMGVFLAISGGYYLLGYYFAKYEAKNRANKNESL